MTTAFRQGNKALQTLQPMQLLKTIGNRDNGCSNGYLLQTGQKIMLADPKDEHRTHSSGSVFCVPAMLPMHRLFNLLLRGPSSSPCCTHSEGQPQMRPHLGHACAQRKQRCSSLVPALRLLPELGPNGYQTFRLFARGTMRRESQGMKGGTDYMCG